MEQEKLYVAIPFNSCINEKAGFINNKVYKNNDEFLDREAAVMKGRNLNPDEYEIIYTLPGTHDRGLNISLVGSRLNGYELVVIKKQ